MSYKPSDAYVKEFTTASPTTGGVVNADSLPVATANHNGTDDGSFTMTVTNLDTGRYKITGTIPGGYASGDVLNVSIAATVGGVAGKAIIDTQILDSKRISDLHDASVLTDYQQRGVAVTLPANPPAGFLGTASYDTAPAWFADTSGITTLLSRLSSTRAGYLDNLSVAPPTVTQIWSTALPGSYGSGTAGYIVGTNRAVTLAAAGVDGITIESGVNLRQAMSVIIAALAGQISGQDANSPVIKAAGSPSTTRISATTDSNGNRSSITLNLPS